MKEWKTYRLGDIITISSGFPYKGEFIGKGNNYLLGMGCVSFKETFLNSGMRQYSGDAPERYVAHSGDIVLATRQQSDNLPILGMPAIIPQDYNDRKMIIGANLYKVQNESEFSNGYIYWLMKSPAYIHHIKSCQTGTTVRMITKANIEDFTFKAPQKSEREKISSILWNIEEKIALNRQINDNLEQQAQALYKSWFVDFEPFKDCEFVDSELGLIPEGWQVGTYEQIIQTTISGDWGKEIITGNYTHKVACVRGCDFQDMSIGIRGKTPERYILEKNYQAKRLIDNDVIVEISGGTSTISTGRVCLINADLLGKYNNDIVCTNFCKVVRPIQSYGAYLYYSWKYKYDCRVMFGYENGTSGIKNFQISDFLSKEPVIIPSESSIKEFQTIIDTLQNNIQTNGSEIMKLESLRDSLLPKLMSGELKINEIDC